MCGGGEAPRAGEGHGAKKRRGKREGADRNEERANKNNNNNNNKKWAGGSPWRQWGLLHDAASQAARSAEKSLDQIGAGGGEKGGRRVRREVA